VALQAETESMRQDTDNRLVANAGRTIVSFYQSDNDPDREIGSREDKERSDAAGRCHAHHVR